ncbi:hypothetical protein AKJ09_02341 [Labilithrix luteola]|uniref:Uncharacterized protein n=1 Tax=Labilithrix luteola TaxID=1391654 RepID=A0A0K1PQ77_9BACT|nr:hypothetical protein [Labilithrix luteola]AKU95677.1 hypothetical protein AKJ09_02341 [Labilithrix luteola]
MSCRIISKDSAVACRVCGRQITGEAWERLILRERLEPKEVQRILLGWSDRFCVEVRYCGECGTQIAVMVAVQES